MKYLKTFSLSTQKYHHTHIYPYNVFEYKDIVPFIFNSITVFYGNNGSGKSTILNLIAQKLHIKGQEMPIVNTYGNKNYCEQFLNECRYTFDSDDYGHIIKQIPKQSLYLNNVDITLKLVNEDIVIPAYSIIYFNQDYLNYYYRVKESLVLKKINYLTLESQVGILNNTISKVIISTFTNI